MSKKPFLPSLKVGKEQPMPPQVGLPIYLDKKDRATLTKLAVAHIGRDRTEELAIGEFLRQALRAAVEQANERKKD